MGVNKRFYWLKLPEDFYSDKAIKLLSKYEKGSTYICIYLKMLLKSLKDSGKLYFEGIVTNIAEEIALDIDESTEDVQATLDFLKERDMAIITDTSIELTRINEMIGSETNKAEKMRRLRKEQNGNNVTPKGNNVTPNGNNVTQKGNIVQKRYPILEKDIDIEKDIDTDIKEKNTKKEKPVNPVKRFQKPTVEEVQTYCLERHNGIDANNFVDFYESKGWLVGKTPMKDWKATVRNWERNRKQNQTGTNNKQNQEWWF